MLNYLQQHIEEKTTIGKFTTRHGYNISGQDYQIIRLFLINSGCMYFKGNEQHSPTFYWWPQKVQEQKTKEEPTPYIITPPNKVIDIIQQSPKRWSISKICRFFNCLDNPQNRTIFKDYLERAVRKKILQRIGKQYASSTNYKGEYKDGMKKHIKRKKYGPRVYNTTYLEHMRLIGKRSAELRRSGLGLGEATRQAHGELDPLYKSIKTKKHINQEIKEDYQKETNSDVITKSDKIDIDEVKALWEKVSILHGNDLKLLFLNQFKTIGKVSEKDLIFMNSYWTEGRQTLDWDSITQNFLTNQQIFLKDFGLIGDVKYTNGELIFSELILDEKEIKEYKDKLEAFKNEINQNPSTLQKIFNIFKGEKNGNNNL